MNLHLTNLRTLLYLTMLCGTLLSALSLVSNVVLGASTPFESMGSYTVKEIEHAELVDQPRHRKVPLKVFIPQGQGPFPLIIFSHGAAGNFDANITQAQHLASHGYVVVAPTHLDSSNLKFRYYISRRGGRMSPGAALHRITCDADAALERPGDVKFAIDMALKWNSGDADLKGRIQPNEIGVTGHSFGAYTTEVVCGAKPRLNYLIAGSKPLPLKVPANLADPRVKAGVALSPQGPGTVCFDEKSFASIDRPMLWITGTKDTQKKFDGTQMPATARQDGFALMPPGDKYLAWLINADHMGFSYNPKQRFELIRSPARDDQQRIAKAMTVVFFDAYLKDSKDARNCLNQNYASSLCGTQVPKIEFTER